LEKKVRVAMDWTLDLCFTKDFACVTTPSRAGRRATLLSSLETEPAAMRAVKDIVLTRAEFSGLSRMQQMIKHSNLPGNSSSGDSNQKADGTD
jgi:hypothetical protein